MFEGIRDIIINGYSQYAQYLWSEITLQNDGGIWRSYFWLLIFISAFFFGLEIIKPWREKQPLFRKDFWLDFFYMFFNFFLFSLVIYNAGSDVVVHLFNDAIQWATSFDLQASNPMKSWPLWGVLLTGFLVRDFVQWMIHRLLHRSERLWEFHKVHHSVEEMGFAAHLRYHWMENIVYRTIEYIPLAILGIGLHDFFLIHIFTLAWGHYNHSNISLPGWLTGGVLGMLITLFIFTTEVSLDLMLTILVVLSGFVVGALALGKVMKYIFNSPEMHIWHHAYEMPEDKPYGINFGLTLAIWDYLFDTARIPHDGKNIKLGFPGLKQFPSSFFGQLFQGFRK